MVTKLQVKMLLSKKVQKNWNLDIPSNVLPVDIKLIETLNIKNDEV
jgi:hypothetical protein